MVSDKLCIRYQEPVLSSQYTLFNDLLLGREPDLLLGREPMEFMLAAFAKGRAWLMHGEQK